MRSENRISVEDATFRRLADVANELVAKNLRHETIDVLDMGRLHVALRSCQMTALALPASPQGGAGKGEAVAWAVYDRHNYIRALESVERIAVAKATDYPSMFASAAPFRVVPLYRESP